MFLIMGIFLVSFASAIDTIGTFKPGEEFNITNFCSSADCTYMNLESITYPSGEVIFINKPMNKVGQEFTYNFTTEELGIYLFRTCADPKGSAMCERDSLLVNPTGTNFTTAEGILYFFVIGLILMLLYFSIHGVKKATRGVWTIAYICMTYISLYTLMGITYLLAKGFLWAMPIVEKVLYIVWFVMGIGFFPFIIVISLYILGQEAKAVLQNNLIKEGYSRDEARELSKNHKR